MQKFVPRSCVRIFRNERTLRPKLTFWCVSYQLGASRTFWLPYETRWKTNRTSAKVCATKSRRNFSQRTHLMFWCVLYYLGVFGNVWLPHETRCKTGRTSAKVRATKWRRNFSQPMHPIHPIGPRTDILECLLLFGFIRDRSLALRNTVQNGPNKCKSSCHEVASDFFATKAPDPTHVTLN